MGTKDSVRCKVAQKRREANGVTAIYLEPVDGELPPFEAGAHLDVFMEDGLVRQYSICSDPQDRSHYRLAVLLTPETRGGSRFMHSLAVGQVVEVGAPRNDFALADPSADSVLIAGGIGVTPLLAMAYALHNAGLPFRLLYLTRSRSQTPFRKELAKSPFRDSVQLHHSEQQQRLNQNALMEFIGSPGQDRHLYLCGPQALIDSCVSAAESLAWKSANVHSERFLPDPSACAGKPVTLLLKRTGKTIDVPENTSLANALVAAGVRLSLSCERGICGTCLADVLEGTPDHRDTYLTAEEKAAGKKIALCCSRAVSSTLVLDL